MGFLLFSVWLLLGLIIGALFTAACSGISEADKRARRELDESRQITREEFGELAKKHKPPQSWYDEKFDGCEKQ